LFRSYKLAAARGPPAAATMAEGLKWCAATRSVGLPMAWISGSQNLYAQSTRLFLVVMCSKCVFPCYLPTIFFLGCALSDENPSSYSHRHHTVYDTQSFNFKVMKTVTF
jgi:hypothetical protein